MIDTLSMLMSVVLVFFIIARAAYLDRKLPWFEARRRGDRPTEPRAAQEGRRPDPRIAARSSHR
jgi:hypothetical protein